MKTKSILLFVAMGILMCSCGTTSNVTYRPSPGMTVQCIQLASNGDCIVSIQETGISREAATDAAMRSAVYQLLFGGLQGSADNRIQPIPALINNPSVQQEKNSYFNSFFKDGTYQNYVEVLPGSVPKVARLGGGYRVTLTIVLKKESLRKKLESDNIIKSLSNAI